MERSDESGDRVKLEIFLVEDNPADVVLFKQALRKCAVLHSLSVATDGAEAVRRLKESSSSPQRPDVVFLDLNLPGLSGAELLAEMKGDPNLATIPVAILTGSDLIQDRVTCAALGVDAYFYKAVALQDFFALATEIGFFLSGLPWFPQRQNGRRVPVGSAA